MPSSVISSQSMHLGVLAIASHAVTTQTPFCGVLQAQDKSVHHMLEQVFGVCLSTTNLRFSGTITGVEDISPQWTNSRWRSLKVHWDEHSSAPRPERASPWEIEPFAPSVPVGLSQSNAAKNKRPRPPSELPSLGKRNGGHFIWHRKQADVNSTSSSVRRAHTDGG
ncbi:hypothetical protein MLD38_031280 [Melastoma candidum]|uniref:Uncharacterized protein n=1 Tax=Melastoma candidum TaxID=119954 RepID=A0ACB9MP86_9MYRT|nr:hypothetical protein MLD38_031280 [Melastoma candidum]